MYRIICIPELKTGQNGTECFGSEGTDDFDTREEAEEWLREFWLPETNSIRGNYRIEKI